MASIRFLPTALLAFSPFLALPAARAQEPEFRFGIEERVRNEDWNNLFDFSRNTDDQRRQVRYRSRAWAQLPLTSFFEFNIGLNSETSQKIGAVSVMDEGIFETLNVRFPKLFIKGLSLKVGRQDLVRGDGLILLDGTPGDGTRTSYLNAAVLAYEFGKSKIEAMGILNPRQDRFFPRMNDQHKYLQDWDDQAVGLYYTDKNLPGATLEAYFFHKKEIHDRFAAGNPQFQPDRRVETSGIRFSQRLTERWTAAAEFAGQWGLEGHSIPIRAWAASGSVRRQSEAKGRPWVQAGLWILSGDDPSHPERVSGWDPLFSRGPRWGDMDLYSEMPEKGIGYATNQKRWHLEAGFSPRKRLTWKFVYYKLDAFHHFARNPAVFGLGTDRGNNLQTRLDFKLNNHLRGHVDYQTLLPGDFYAHRDPAYFLRFELIADARVSVKKFSQLFGAGDAQKPGGKP